VCPLEESLGGACQLVDSWPAQAASWPVARRDADQCCAARGNGSAFAHRVAWGRGNWWAEEVLLFVTASARGPPKMTLRAGRSRDPVGSSARGAHSRAPEARSPRSTPGLTGANFKFLSRTSKYQKLKLYMGPRTTTFTNGNICFEQSFGWEGTLKLAESSAWLTVQNSFDQVFGYLPLRIWNAANWGNVFPEVANNFRVGRFSSWCTKF
jgi:hypothetical protein